MEYGLNPAHHPFSGGGWKAQWTTGMSYSIGDQVTYRDLLGSEINRRNALGKSITKIKNIWN